MNCPQCATILVMSERSGVEIDYCPQCRGVWLDRGELDKIIDRTAQANTPFGHDRASPFIQDGSHRPKHHSHGHPEGRSYHKKSWVGELFDF